VRRRASDARSWIASGWVIRILDAVSFARSIARVLCCVTDVPMMFAVNLPLPIAMIAIDSRSRSLAR
jgi:hypothetical protein